MEGSHANPPAGWYEDPDDAALQRFWNGSRWTNSRMPRNEGVPLEGDVSVEPSRYASDALDAPPASAPGGLTQPTGGAAANLPPASWYADPENATGMRYWDGTRWTEHRTNYRAKAPKPASEGMVAAGYILSFLLPVAGVVIGIILMNRDSRHGRWILALSVVFFIGFVILGQTIDENR